MGLVTSRKAVTGLEGISAVLKGLPNEMRTKLLTAAVAKAGQPVKRRMQQLAPRDTGALQASIGMKVVNNSDAATAACMVGPDRSYYRGKTRVGRHESRRGADKPENYAHLLEFGHVTVQPKKGTRARHGAVKIGFVAPRPFIRPALEESEGEIADALQRGLADGIDEAVERLKT